MPRSRAAFVALAVGVLVGASARRSGGRRASEPPLPLGIRSELAAVERRLDHTVRSLDRDRRRTGALTFAIAVLIVVPAALLAARPDVPDAVVAGVLAADLLAAVVAMLVAIRVDRSGRR